MAEMTGGQALVASLISYGVDTIFGLPGVQLDNTFDAIYEQRDEVRLVHTRHEQSTTYMAFGYARATGRVGVYLVVPGPGLLNTTAALSTAYATNTPVLALSGQVHSDEIGKGYGSLHEIPHQLEMISQITKWAARIEQPAQTPEMVREAFRQLTTGRQRPVELEMPPDIMGKREDVELLEPIERFPDPLDDVDHGKIEQAAQLLAESEKPVIVAGGGTIDSGGELAQLAETLQAPIIMTPNARGAVSDRHPLALTLLGGRKVYEDTDLVLAVGTRFDRVAGDWGIDRNMKVIRIDVDPSEVTRHHTPDVAIVARAGAALSALREAVEKIDRPRESREREVAAAKEWADDQLFEFQPSDAFARAIREELPDDAVLVSEVTQLGAYSEIGMPFYQPRTYVGAGYQGTLGFGFATALGAQVGVPDNKVISINGDGGFMYTMPELSTAVRHQIPLVAIVINDGAYGNVKHIQQTRYGGREIANTLSNPDLVKLAESFGAAGLRARTAEDLKAAIREGLENNHPTLIDVPVDRLPPIRQITRGRIRG